MKDKPQKRVPCRNCRGTIRTDWAEQGRIFCSDTCRRLANRRAYEVAIPKESFRKLRKINAIFGISYIDAMRIAIDKYYDQRFNNDQG